MAQWQRIGYAIVCVKKERVTVQEIARLAGVAPSTVSRALRSHPSIPAQTRQRIEEIARKSGYRPDPLISALLERRYKRTAREVDVIAYVTPQEEHLWRRSYFHACAYRGAEEQALKRGYRLEHFPLTAPGMNGRRLSRILYHRGIQGVLIAPLGRPYQRINLDWEHFSCATIGYSLIRPSLHRVCPHYFHNMFLALRSLRHMQCRRIASILTDNMSKRNGQMLLSAITLHRHLYSKAAFPLFNASAYTERETARAAIGKWLETQRFDAVFGVGTLPVMLLKPTPLVPEGIVLAAMGKSSPHDPWPVLDQKPEVVGAAAIDVIIGQIQRNERGIPEHPKVVMVEGVWEPASPLAVPS